MSDDCCIRPIDRSEERRDVIAVNNLHWVVVELYGYHQHFHLWVHDVGLRRHLLEVDFFVVIRFKVEG